MSNPTLTGMEVESSSPRAKRRNANLPSFWECRNLIKRSTLSPQQKLLLYILADYAGDEEWTNPKHRPELAQDLSLSDRQTRQLIADLEPEREVRGKKGEVPRKEPGPGIVERKRSGRGKPNRYRVCWDRLREHQQDRQPTAYQKNPREAAHRLQDRQPTADSDRQPTADPPLKPSHGNIPTKPHGNGDGALDACACRNGGGWDGGGIAADEFRSWDRCRARFDEALRKGWLTSADERRFFTNWSYVKRHHWDRQETDKHRLKKPGAAFTARIRNPTSKTADEDEDIALAVIRDQRERVQPSPAIRDAAANLRLADDPGDTSPEAEAEAKRKAFHDSRFGSAAGVGPRRVDAQQKGVRV